MKFMYTVLYAILTVIKHKHISIDKPHWMHKSNSDIQADKMFDQKRKKIKRKCVCVYQVLKSSKKYVILFLGAMKIMYFSWFHLTTATAVTPKKKCS